MSDITIEKLHEALEAVSPVPSTQEDRKKVLDAELDKRFGTHTSFKTDNREEQFSPSLQYLNWIETGNVLEKT